MKAREPSHNPSKRFEDSNKTKLAASELTEADLGRVSGSYPNVKRIVAQTVIGE